MKQLELNVTTQDLHPSIISPTRKSNSIDLFPSQSLHQSQPLRAQPQPLPQQQPKQNIQTKPKSKRRYQPLGLYIAVCFCETITIFISLLLLVVGNENKKYVYLTYIIMTPVRSLVFLGNSIYLIGLNMKLIKLYLLLDNVFLVQLASIITYIFLNFKSPIENATGAIICYPILLFFMVGNFRVMLVYCQWNKIQVIIYKIIKIIGATYFLVYGGYLIILTEDNTTSDLFMLWVFTTCGFWAEMCFSVNGFDQADKMSTRYRLEDEQDMEEEEEQLKRERERQGEREKEREKLGLEKRDSFTYNEHREKANQTIENQEPLPQIHAIMHNQHTNKVTNEDQQPNNFL